MELRRGSVLLLLLIGCAAARPKNLIIPDEMRRPLVTGQTVAEANAPRSSIRAATAGVDDLTKPQTPGPVPTADGSPPAAPGAAPAPAPAASVAPAVRPAMVPQRPAQTVRTDPAQRYSLRLVERGRVWELELPESAGAYEVRIPLGPGYDQPNLADQEMLGKTPAASLSKSYLSTLAKVGEMYANHRFELALIEIVDLEQQYPKDSRILAMKGSLYQRLGKTALAREAWKKALEIDPSDTTVAEALRALKEE